MSTIVPPATKMKIIDDPSRRPLVRIGVQNAKPSPAIGPAVINRHRMQDDDDVLDTCPAAMRIMRKAWERIVASADQIMANPMLPPLANAREVSRMVAAIAHSTCRSIDDARAIVRDELAKLEKSMAVLKPRDSFEQSLHAEIRRTLAGLPTEQRNQIISEALSEGDDVILGALLVGHPVTAGMSKAQRAMLRSRWQRARYPAETDRVSRITAALADVDKAVDVFLPFTLNVVDGEAIKAAEAAERAAKAAAA